MACLILVSCDRKACTWSFSGNGTIPNDIARWDSIKKTAISRFEITITNLSYMYVDHFFNTSPLQKDFK